MDMASKSFTNYLHVWPQFLPGPWGRRVLGVACRSRRVVNNGVLVCWRLRLECRP